MTSETRSRNASAKTMASEKMRPRSQAQLPAHTPLVGAGWTSQMRFIVAWISPKTAVRPAAFPPGPLGGAPCPPPALPVQAALSRSTLCGALGARQAPLAGAHGRWREGAAGVGRRTCRVFCLSVQMLWAIGTYRRHRASIAWISLPGVEQCFRLSYLHRVQVLRALQLMKPQEPRCSSRW
jgi:hypothetical protein